MYQPRWMFSEEEECKRRSGQQRDSHASEAVRQMAQQLVDGPVGSGETSLNTGCARAQIWPTSFSWRTCKRTTQEYIIKREACS